MCCLINLALPLAAACLCTALVFLESVCYSELVFSHGGSSCVFPWPQELCQTCSAVSGACQTGQARGDWPETRSGLQLGLWAKAERYSSFAIKPNKY